MTDPRTIQANFRLILKGEIRRAEVVAARVLGIRKISVWEVLIPILFIFGFMQTRQRRDLFAQNLMFTKRRALKGARDIRLKNISTEDVLTAFDAHCKELLKDERNRNVYSAQIQCHQRREIELMLDHYLRLLDADGDCHDALIQAAYPDADQYRAYINDLMAIEDQALNAARETLGNQADRNALERLRKTSRAAYRNHAGRLYPQSAEKSS